MNALIIATCVSAAAILIFTPALRRSSAWKATVTPLSSIMGSGFLVSAPLVASVTGVWAPVGMGALLLVAFAIGSMIRFNIRHAEPASDTQDQHEHGLHCSHHDTTRGHWITKHTSLRGLVEKASHVVLAGAYVVSVSYYLQLLSAFVLERAGIDNQLYARLGTTTILLLIGVIGVAWGLKALEKVETVAVGLNLGTILALVVGLLVYNVTQYMDGTLSVSDLPAPGAGGSVHSARVMMGLLIVVQGFETSRFLGAEHSVEERVKTMRIAQLIAASIYIVFITLMLPLLTGDLEADVTAIVGFVGPVASVLPWLVVIAAVGSQFSAAVADDAGCAGLLTSMMQSLPRKVVYGSIAALAIGITWLTDPLTVISIASRAFALFYTLQCGVTALTAYKKRDAPHRRLYIAGGTVLALVALSVTVFGVPAG